MTDHKTLKRTRVNDTDVAGPSKQVKLGDEPQQQPEGGVNYIEIDGKTCTHAVAWPEDVSTPDLSPPAARKGPAAKEFPFTLDPFQRTAINCLEAGKTANHRSKLCINHIYGHRPVNDSHQHLRKFCLREFHIGWVLPSKVCHHAAFEYLTCVAGASVLVAAHTSAGKTVIAQYCCAMGLR